MDFLLAQATERAMWLQYDDGEGMWVSNLFESEFDEAYDITSADFDLDGDEDVLVAYKNSLAYYEVRSFCFVSLNEAWLILALSRRQTRSQFGEAGGTVY